jgi:hypothetical protein
VAHYVRAGQEVDAILMARPLSDGLATPGTEPRASDP